MGFTRSYLISLLLYVSIVNEIRQPAVTCQDEEGSQCIPRKTFMALLRLPEVSSNLAAYSRTVRIIQDTKNRNDMFHLKEISSEEGDDAEVCIPGGIYLELFRDPALRGHLSAIARTHKLPEFPGRRLDDSDEINTRDIIPESEKRSLATLAKNDDLPVHEHEDEGDDDEKRSAPTNNNDNIDGLMGTLLDDEYLRRSPAIYELLPEPDFEIAEYKLDKRNIGSLARDSALPTGRRHIASVARDYGIPNGKRNIGALARQSTLPLSGKRNIASLARYYMLPQTDKRNVGSLARDSSLPSGKRYLGALARSISGYPNTREYNEDKYGARKGNWPELTKRRGTIVGSIFLRVRPLNRKGRSLSDDRDVHNEPLDLQQLIRQGNDRDNDIKAKNPADRKIDTTSQTRHKRQIDFSDEYPLPVMQNANMLDYEEIFDTLDHYPNTEKRFMGSMAEIPADSGYLEVLQPSKRHIGSLARIGWLPSFRASRFSRSPRYLVERENPADGSSSDYTPNSSTRSLRPFIPKTRYLQSLHGDCRNGFKRFLLLPDVDNFLEPKSRIPSRAM